MMADQNSKIPSIPQWFSNREVFITGGTGFMGKVMLSKLLMGCPEISKVYAIIRDKKGVCSKNRLNNLMQEEPFRLLRENHPERLKKLVAVSGDTTYAGLGLSEEDAETLRNNVSVIINMAANVRFDMPLKTAVNMNTKSAANIISFAKQVKKLESFVHVSTAYCHCGEPVLEERYYPVCTSPEEIMEIVDNTPEETLNTLTAKILGDQPNTYAFSKGLSEDLVYRSGLPAGVARPSIVVGAWKEPDYGWVDNMNGPTGLMIGAGKGVIRTMLCNADLQLDVIPVDMAVNATIALAWQVGLRRPDKPIFVNLTEGGENSITWNYAIETGKKHIYANPFSGPLWYPGGKPTTSKTLYLVTAFLFHTIPAYFLDAMIMLTGNKPFLVRVQARVTYGINLVHYYTTKQWAFKNEKLKALRQSLCPEDKRVFFMDIREISWDKYMLHYILSTRKYCLKDDPSTLPRARRVLAILHVADIVVKFLFTFLCGWIVYRLLSSYKMTIGTTLDTTYIP